MEHHIAVNAVVFRIRALHGIDDTAQIALVMKDVVELHRQRQGIVTQQTVAHLRVPYKFVGIQRLVTISPAAVLMQIRRHARTPRQSQVYVCSV